MNYMPIRSGTLRGDQKIDFDVYIHVGDKYIAFVRAGYSFDGERLKKFIAQQVKQFYIRVEDHDKYMQFHLGNVKRAFDPNIAMTIELRSQVVLGLQEALAEQVMEDPYNPKEYESAKEQNQKFTTFFVGLEQAMNLLVDGTLGHATLGRHCAKVAMISLFIAQKLGMKDPKQLEMLSLGALIHDIGHMGSKTPFNIVMEKMSPEEKTEYKKHPAHGIELVTQAKHFDQAVISIVQQHEELSNGSGFPRGLKRAELDHLGQIVSTANALDRYISFMGMSPDHAARQMVIDRVGFHPVEHLNVLKDLK